jgi:hypothetical protein
LVPWDSIDAIKHSPERRFMDKAEQNACMLQDPSTKDSGALLRRQITSFRAA